MTLDDLIIFGILVQCHTILKMTISQNRQEKSRKSSYKNSQYKIKLSKISEEPLHRKDQLDMSAFLVWN